MPWLVPATSIPGSLFERENVLSAEAGRFLQPVLSGIVGIEHAAVFAVVDDANVERAGVFVIGQNGGHIAMRVAFVGSGPVGSAISRGHHAAAVGSEQHAIGIPRIDEYVIDDDLRIAHTLPHFAQIG